MDPIIGVVNLNTVTFPIREDHDRRHWVYTPEVQAAMCFSTDILADLVVRTMFANEPSSTQKGGIGVGGNAPNRFQLEEFMTKVKAAITRCGARVEVEIELVSGAKKSSLAKLIKWLKPRLIH